MKIEQKEKIRVNKNKTMTNPYLMINVSEIQLNKPLGPAKSI